MRPDPGNSRLTGSRLLGDRSIHEVFYPGGMRQEHHRHSKASFSFVALGRYEERIGRRAHSRMDSTLVYHPAGESHAVEFQRDVRILSVEFGRESVEKIADGRDRGFSHRSELIGWLGSRLGREIVRRDNASVLAIDSLISEMLAEASRGRVLTAEKGTPKWLTKAVEFVHDNFSVQFDLDDAAAVSGVHPAHLSRVFRQKMRCTVGEYIRRLRFEFACRQILSSDDKLCEVAIDAGFADQSHFHRQFRTKMGITPMAYRKIHRGR